MYVGDSIPRKTEFNGGKAWREVVPLINKSNGRGNQSDFFRVLESLLNWGESYFSLLRKWGPRQPVAVHLRNARTSKRHITKQRDGRAGWRQPMDFLHPVKKQATKS